MLYLHLIILIIFKMLLYYCYIILYHLGRFITIYNLFYYFIGTFYIIIILICLDNELKHIEIRLGTILLLLLLFLIYYSTIILNYNT